jgi:hypothetical protein
MTYKVLKNKQLSKLKSHSCEAYVRAIVDADLTAFGDLRNLFFERELGTNILSEIYDDDKLIEMIKEIKR